MKGSVGDAASRDAFAVLFDEHGHDIAEILDLQEINTFDLGRTKLGQPRNQAHLIIRIITDLSQDTGDIPAVFTQRFATTPIVVHGIWVDSEKADILESLSKAPLGDVGIGTSPVTFDDQFLALDLYGGRRPIGDPMPKIKLISLSVLTLILGDRLWH